MGFFICAGTNGWANNWDAGELRRHRAHYDVTVMFPSKSDTWGVFVVGTRYSTCYYLYVATQSSPNVISTTMRWFRIILNILLTIYLGCDTMAMMTSSNGTVFRVTGYLSGEFTGHRWNPRTMVSGAELWCFLWSAPWIDGWVNNREAGDLRRHCAHYDVIVMVLGVVSYMSLLFTAFMA